MHINKRQVKIYMAMNGLTTKALAARMGTQANNLSTVLTRGTCRPETANRIATALGVTVMDIIEEKED